MSYFISFLQNRDPLDYWRLTSQNIKVMSVYFCFSCLDFGVMLDSAFDFPVVYHQILSFPPLTQVCPFSSVLM